MTAIVMVHATCGVCGAASEQLAVASTSSFGPPDLDTRPAELARSTLPEWSASCPRCGYAAGSELCAPADPAALAAVRRCLDDRVYREQAADGTLARAARLAGCRALVADALGRRADAGLFALWAAWACDDAGEERAARFRSAAVEHWRAAQAGGASVFEDAPVLADRVLIAETLRRAGRFAEALEEARIGAGMGGPDELVRVLRFVSACARREDDCNHTVDEAYGGMDARVIGAQANREEG